MLNLAVPLTPPPPDTEAATISPAQFIASSPTRESIKSKILLPEVTKKQAQRFRLEPPRNPATRP